MRIRVMGCSGVPGGLIRAGGESGRLCCDEVKNGAREDVKQIVSYEVMCGSVVRSVCILREP